MYAAQVLARIFAGPDFFGHRRRRQDVQQVGEVALSNGACPGPIAPSIEKRLRHAANLEAAANEKDPSRMDAMVTAALASVANALLPPNALLNMTGPSA